MKSKEELYSPVYGCVFLNEKEEVQREDFDPKVLESLIYSWSSVGVPNLSDHPNISSRFPVDENELLEFYKMLRDTYQMEILKNQQLIQMYENIDYSSYSTKHPFEDEIEDWKKNIEKLTKMKDSLDKGIENLEKESKNE